MQLCAIIIKIVSLFQWVVAFIYVIRNVLGLWYNVGWISGPKIVDPGDENIKMDPNPP